MKIILAMQIKVNLIKKRIIYIFKSILNRIFSFFYQLNFISKEYRNTLTFKTRYGFLTINKYDKYFIDTFMNNEYWDHEILSNVFHDYIEKGNILEIGAHVGTSTMFYAKHIEPEYIIYAFEPQKKIFDLLCLNISQNKFIHKVKAINKALFCYNGVLKLNSIDLDGPHKNNLISNLEHKNLNINYGGIGIGENGESIKCITFNSLNIENVKFIHCDAQGAEPYIFCYAEDFIKKYRPVILFENYLLYGDYLFNNIKKIYPEFNKESNFNLKKYCCEELGYTSIDNIFGSKEDTLLIPYHKTEWNKYCDSESNLFDCRLLNIYQIPNTLIRIGPKSDGGYVIADNLKYDLFISCGIAADINFEDKFLDGHKNLKCLAFDNTISSFPRHRNSIEWVKKNIGYLNTMGFTNLKEEIKNYDNIFLKMDIEGSEFNWIDSMTNSDLMKFSQIVLEVHWPFDNYRCKMLEKLTETHYCVHVHGNNYSSKNIPSNLPCDRSEDGCKKIRHSELGDFVFPEVFEVTYINKKLFSNPTEVYAIAKSFPTAIDFPNCSKSPDVLFSIPL